MMTRRKKNILTDFASSGIFSDLAFLLLIFFLSVGSFIVKTGITVENSVDTEKKTPSTVEIMLVENEFLFRDKEGWGQRYSTFMTRHKIEKMLLKKPDILVILYASPKAKFQNVISAVDFLKECGVRSISLMK